MKAYNGSPKSTTSPICTASPSQCLFEKQVSPVLGPQDLEVPTRIVGDLDSSALSSPNRETLRAEALFLRFRSHLFHQSHHANKVDEGPRSRQL